MGILTNTHNYLVPAAGTTRAYRETMDFQPGQPVKADFRDMSLDGLSFVPSGVMVDNSRANGDLAIVINEMSWRIVVKAGEFAQMPYPAPYNQTATIEGDGLATVVFVDYPVIPWTSEKSGGGGVSGVIEVVAGNGISVSNADPAKPVVSNGGVLSLAAGANVTIDNTDPANPVISASGGGGGGSNILGRAIGTLLFQNISVEGVAPMMFVPTHVDGIIVDNGTFPVPTGTTYYTVNVGLMASNNQFASMLEIADTPWLSVAANQDSAATFWAAKADTVPDNVLAFKARLESSNSPTGTFQVMVDITFYND